jgi:hypothetical protein
MNHFREKNTDFFMFKMEIRELLDLYEFPGDDTPIIVGSALKAQQDMLSCLWHWTICCSTNQDSTVHLRGTGNHVFHIIRI